MRFFTGYVIIPLLLANTSAGYVQTPYKQSVVTAPYQVGFYFEIKVFFIDSLFFHWLKWCFSIEIEFWTEVVFLLNVNISEIGPFDENWDILRKF